eukprot:TRINITY_DN362_c4_g1_i1.p1 TRINITY_DN362_c4_g1~~TRINITY_DN362_c4_g1_i1.p1  ORF type:complete len:618 (-),score=203.10 TRINITY_DN362_c4_g1_i1:1049-2902(-)
MSSRATLGPISTSQANSRMSLGPARLVTHKLSMAPPSVSRHSMMPRRKTSVGAGGGKSGRTSSIGHRKSSVFPKSGTVRDTRPVSDKSVMQSSVRKIITYLTEHGFDQAISPKTLMSPSNKDFVHVLEFLMQQIDPSFTVKGKIEEVVPPLFQFLKYPFQLHKRILLCVGSPLTWPQLLAALSWLVDLVSIHESAGEKREEKEDIDNGERLFFDYLQRSYLSFIGGDDDFEELDKELEETFESRNSEIMQEIEQLEGEMASMSSELDELKTKPSPLTVLESRRKDHLSDIAKFRSLIQKLEGHRTELDKRLNERNVKLQKRRRDVETLESRKESIRKVLEDQESRNIDARKIAHDREQAQEEARQSASHKEEKQKQQWDLEEERRQFIEELEKEVQQHNARCIAMKLVPVSAKYARGIGYELSLKSEGMSVNTVLQAQLKEEIKPGLKRLRELFMEKFNESQEALGAAREEFEQTQESVGDQKEEQSSLQEKLSRLEKKYAEEKKRAAAEREEIKREGEKIEDTIQQLHRALQETKLRDTSAPQIELLEEQFKSLASESEVEENTMRCIVRESREKLVHHREFIESKLADLGDYAEKKAEEMNARKREAFQEKYEES